jgi:hypothetical protein
MAFLQNWRPTTPLLRLDGGRIRGLFSPASRANDASIAVRSQSMKLVGSFLENQKIKVTISV